MLFLAIETSCTVFSSLPPFLLGLQHCFRPMDQDTTIVPSGGRSFYSCITLATGLLEKESAVSVYTWLDLQRTSYSFIYGFSLVPGWTHPCA